MMRIDMDGPTLKFKQSEGFSMNTTFDVLIIMRTKCPEENSDKIRQVFKELQPMKENIGAVFLDTNPTFMEVMKPYKSMLPVPFNLIKR